MNIDTVFKWLAFISATITIPMDPSQGAAYFVGVAVLMTVYLFIAAPIVWVYVRITS
ncbi:hypothetical protein [Vibrio phage VpV262]|uniref:Uncharacterized protein n=1 Tax=Vibrio phage VpV262 TaxID=2907796 RepID=Q8LT96_9CAUD|nr:hypothetical protein VpV262p03 [Vibrio phage VpV262]AAM28351.1 hypothetical protein [Vibrio phage VpV262]